MPAAPSMRAHSFSDTPHLGSSDPHVRPGIFPTLLHLGSSDSHVCPGRGLFLGFGRCVGAVLRLGLSPVQLSHAREPGLILLRSFRLPLGLPPPAVLCCIVDLSAHIVCSPFRCALSTHTFFPVI